ncbi:WD40 repeat-like protein [Wallemia mellicola]|uniref:Protein transport protein SEC31 n=1 Tax=Wallemia mellicola TaxID=1708541 RepID=A0A4T0MDN4_9BASI|nr:WD40 repeat-like protein [Wallemia mellicola]
MPHTSIIRTSTFAWSPFSNGCTIATGTVAGALDENFSNDAQLELWDAFSSETPIVKGSVTTNSRHIYSLSLSFNRLGWGHVNSSRPNGVIAAGLESGEIAIWDPQLIVNDPTNSLLHSNSSHTGSVKGLDFNQLQSNLFATGASQGEVFIWDLNNPSKPYHPGPKSQKLEDITSTAWNAQVPHVLASSSDSGYTVVWDLRHKKEVVGISYGGGAGTMGGPFGNSSAITQQGRRGISAVAWHPDNATRLVTASEDDTSPVIMLWDLRNARAPEKILTGHDKGVLSLSWCRQDPDLLLSSGKDNKTLAWNPNTGENIGELPTSNNWSFEVEWNHRNPDIFATASFDGTIGIHSIQSQTPSPESIAANVQQAIDPNDIFGAVSAQQEAEQNALRAQQSFSLKQAPKWLRRPTSVGFGYGGKLVTLKNNLVQIHQLSTEPSILERAKILSEAIDSPDGESKLINLCQSQVDKNGGDCDTWKALHSLFEANSRDQLVQLLGFSKEEVAKQVQAAIDAFPKPAEPTVESTQISSITSDAPEKESTVSFVEPESKAEDETAEEPKEEENKPEETKPEESKPEESTPQEEPQESAPGDSLFGDSKPDGDDFFRSVAVASESTPQAENVVVPHTTADESVAATVGSPGPSSIASEAMKANTFKIYPSEESESDRLITKALVLGDFESAVELCLSTERYADAILLAVKGGSELLAKTQKSYFQRQTAHLPYLRLFQSIVSDDLSDIVQNADLNEWQEIFVVLCTFAKSEEFGQLAEQLGQRLDFQYRVADEADKMGAKKYRTNAILCYLAAGKLERVVNIWSDEMLEEESSGVGEHTSKQSQHALALQSFIEKVTIFQKATGYVDQDLNQPTESPTVAASGVRVYKLSTLYDRYHEYAELLASQGLVKDAVKYINLTPVDYKGAAGASSDAQTARERLLIAASDESQKEARKAAAAEQEAQQEAQQQAQAAAQEQMKAQQPVQSTSAYAPASVAQAPLQQAAPSYSSPYAPQTNSNPYAPPAQTQAYNPSAQQQTVQQPQAPTYGGYAPPPQPTMHAPPVATNPYAPVVPAPTTAAATAADTYNPYNAPAGVAPPVSVPEPATSQTLPPPPPQRTAVPASQRRDLSGWNDAPPPPPPKRGTTPSNTGSRASPIVQPLTSPFPNSSPVPTPGIGGPPQAGSLVPPPPKAGTKSMPPPPPPASSIPPPPPKAPPAAGPPMTSPMVSAPAMAPPPATGPPMTAPPAAVPPPPPAGPPAGRMMSPSFGQQAQTPQPPAGPPQVQSFGAMANGIQRPGSVNAGGYRQTPPPPPPHLVQQAMQQQQQQRSVISPPPVSSPPVSNVAAYTVSRPGSVASTRVSEAPAQPSFPPGDRSHIPPADRIIFESLSREIEKAKSRSMAQPQTKRMVDDTQNRLNALFDSLNAQTVESQAVLNNLRNVSQALSAQDYNTAMKITLEIMGSGEADMRWALGLKQLIRLTGQA